MTATTARRAAAEGGAHQRCFWSSEGAIATAALQANLMRWLGLAGRHYAAVCFSLPPTTAHDATRVLVCGAMAAIADAVLRVAVPDAPSALSLHYSGRAEGPAEGFAIEMRHYEVECESLLLTAPHLACARTMILDYFRSTIARAPPSHALFRYERSMELGAGERALLSQLCIAFALPRDDATLRMYLSGEEPIVDELFPELATLRDAAFLAKAVTHPSADALPEMRLWTFSDARLVWRVKEDKLTVRAFGGPMQCVAWLDARTASDAEEHDASAPSELHTAPSDLKPELDAAAARPRPRPRVPPSASNASTFAGAAVAEEEDVLHLRHCPTLAASCGRPTARSSCSACSCPTCACRCCCSSSPRRRARSRSPRSELQQTPRRRRFEPSTYQPPARTAPCPSSSRRSTARHLATPARPAHPGAHPRAEAALRGGAPHPRERARARHWPVLRGGRSTAVMLYTIRLAVRVVAYARFTLSDEGLRIRGIARMRAQPDAVDAVRQGITTLRAKLEDHALPVLQDWYTKLRAADSPQDACTCAAHLAFIVGGYSSTSELDGRSVFWLLSSRVFINMHHGDLDFAMADAEAHAGSRQKNRRPSLADAQRGRPASSSSDHAPVLGFPPLELVSMWQRHLGAMLRWLRAHPTQASEIMEALAQLEPVPSAGKADVPRRQWSSMAGCGCAGRYVLARSASERQHGLDGDDEAAAWARYEDASLGSPWTGDAAAAVDLGHRDDRGAARLLMIDGARDGRRSGWPLPSAVDVLYPARVRLLLTRWRRGGGARHRRRRQRKSGAAGPVGDARVRRVAAQPRRVASRDGDQRAAGPAHVETPPHEAARALGGRAPRLCRRLWPRGRGEPHPMRRGEADGAAAVAAHARRAPRPSHLVDGRANAAAASEDDRRRRQRATRGHRRVDRPDVRGAQGGDARAARDRRPQRRAGERVPRPPVRRHRARRPQGGPARALAEQPLRLRHRLARPLLAARP